jgi:hypothetical protein
LENEWLLGWSLRNQRSELVNGDYAQLLEAGNEQGVQFDSEFVLDNNVTDLPKTSDLTDAELVTSPGFQRASELLYNAMVGDKNRSGVMTRRKKAALQRAPKTPEEYAAWGIEYQGSLEYNLPKAAINFSQLGKLAKDNPQLAVASLALQEEYAKLGISWNGTKRFFAGMFSDPTTYVGLSTLGWGFLGRQGAKQTTKKGINSFLRKAIDPRLLTVYEAGGYTAAEDYIRQQKQIRSNVADPRTGKSEFDNLQSAISTGIGLAGGGAIVGGIEGAKRVAPYIAEGIRNLGKDADKRIAARNADGGFTLNTGVDPMPAVDSLISSAGKALTDKRVDQDELGFYSNALEQARNLKQNSGQGSQIKGILLNQGVKEDEIKWTGLDEILSKPKVTKDEIVKHLEENRIELKEITLEPGNLDADDTPLNFDDGRVDDISDNWSFRTEDYIYDLQRGQADDYLLDSIRKGLIDEGASKADITYIEQKIAENDYDSLPQNTIQSIENILDNVAYEEYMDNPYRDYYDSTHGYHIHGNDDIGFIVRSPNGDTVADDIYSFNEARVQAETHAFDYGYTGMGDTGDTRWSEYKQPGGDNYREILLANPGFKGDPDLVKLDLPDIEKQEVYNLTRKEAFAKTLTPDMAAKEFTPEMRNRLNSLLQKQQSNEAVKTSKNLNRLRKFNSSHFDEENIVAHVRVTDREGIGPDGLGKKTSKILYAEEIQSDWAQRGRIQGFYNPKARPKDVIVEENKIISNSVFAKLRTLDNAQLNDIRVKFEIEKGNYENELQIPQAFFDTSREQDRFIDDVARILLDLPTMNYQRTIASKDRLDFLKQFDTVKDLIPSLEKRIDNAKEMGEASGETKGPFVDTSPKWTQLALKRLIRQATEQGYDYVAWTPGKVQLDRWGEQGLVDFYDKVLPKSSKEVLKKLDKKAKVEVIKVNVDGNLQDTLAIPITDTIKNQAPKGQPLFTPIAATVGAGTLAKQQMDNENNN